MRGKSILIVDDSILIIDRLQVMLTELNDPGPIRYAVDYPSAMQQIKDFLPDIVLLDINIPGGSGLGVLRYIKMQYPTTVVVMVTNQVGDYYRNACRKLGADHFVDKSSEFEQIPAIISSIL
jgi:DNA-binding NarL/FixJ family response regulator